MSEFSAGNVISRSLSVWSKNLASFTVMSLIVYVPLVVFALVALGGERTLSSIAISQGVIYVGGGFLGLVVNGGVTYGVFQELRGRPATIGQSLAVGLRRTLPIVWIAFIEGLVIIAGFFFLVVPALVFWVMFWLAIPVAIVERPGPIASLERSSALTKGYRWSIFGILVVFALFSGTAAGTVQALLPKPDGSTAAWGASLFATLLVQALVGPLSAVGCAVAYHDLRIAKEGGDTDALAAVFD
jgi:hypothetical protein